MYLRAIFAASLASAYAYTRGIAAGELDFFDFVSNYSS